MSFLSELKKKSEDLQKNEVVHESEEKPIVEEKVEEKPTPKDLLSGPPPPPPQSALPPPPPPTQFLPPVTSPTPTSKNSSSVSQEISSVKLKKTTPPVRNSVPQTEVQNDFNKMLLERQAQLKNKEKVVTGFKIQNKVQTAQYFVSKQKPEIKIDEKEMTQKWMLQLTELKCYFVYCLVDQKDCKITVKGGIMESFDQKYDSFLKSILVDAPGYSIVTNVEKFSSLQYLVTFLLDSKEHLKLIYINNYVDVMAFSYKNTVSSILSILRLVKVKTPYQKNIEMFVSILLESLPKSQLKLFFKNINEYDQTILMELAKQKRVDFLTIILDFIFANIELETELQEIFSLQNQKKDSLISIASKNQLNMIVKRIKKFKTLNEVLLDEIVILTNSQKTKELIEITKDLIEADYSMRLLDNLLLSGFFSDETVCKLFSNYKFGSDEEREWKAFQLALDQKLSNFTLEMVKKEVIPLDKTIEGIPLLHIACGSLEFEELALYLIEKGIPLDLKDPTHETPLFYACRCGNLSLIKKIVGNSEVNHQNLHQKTPLNISIANKRFKVSEYLKNEHSAISIPPIYHKLSADVIEYMLTFVSSFQFDYLNFKLVNSDFYDYANSEALWQSFLFKKYQYEFNHSPHGSFRISGYILKQRDLMMKFVTNQENKFNGISYFASFHNIENWKTLEFKKIFEILSMTHKFDSRVLLNHKLVGMNYIQEIEVATLNSPKIASLPKEIPWREISTDSEFMELLKEEEITKDYIEKLKSCFISNETEALDHLQKKNKFHKEMRFFFGELNGDAGDTFINQQVSGKKFNYFACVAEDFVCVLTSTTRVKQKRINYKSFLKPVK
jgi:hypothetical protein